MKLWNRGLMLTVLGVLAGWCVVGSVTAEPGGLLQRLKERREARQGGHVDDTALTVSFEGREILVHMPANLPAEGTRAMVVVLHGGFGNASLIERTLGMDAVADRDGFVVAYVNGSDASASLGDRFKAWNAGGGCCGLPSDSNVDDVGYLTRAISHMTQLYGIDPQRVYGVGHSNGAMMTQRLMCETDLYRAAVPVSGPLQLDNATCPDAKGKRILAIHGADDVNVPIAGGRGTKGFKGAVFRSQAESEATFKASGASYTLQIVAGADHNLATVDRVLDKASGKGVGATAARFFGLER